MQTHESGWDCEPGADSRLVGMDRVVVECVVVSDVDVAVVRSDDGLARVDFELVCVCLQHLHPLSVPRLSFPP